MSPPLPADGGGGEDDAPGDSSDGSADAGGEPPEVAQEASARTRSTTKKPGTVRLMRALTLSAARRFPPNRARMESMRRLAVALPALVLVTLSAPATALAHGASAPSPELPGLLLRWSLDPLVLAGLLAAAAAWMLAVRR